MARDDRDAVEPDDGDEESPLVGVATGAVTFLTLGVAFSLMFLGVDYFWVAFPVGFGGGMPLAVALAKYYESEGAAERDRERGRRDRGRSDEADDALAELRDRYARGEIDDEEFEARVERLLETESVDDAETFLGTDSPTGDGSDERERDTA
ncbi:hypothetical protein C475_20897 [Halosimplex carlsbadense 2-9-1]|uniref:SHOCT domain-containing protein n=1 Tax=Halosimplex carlsbadense 2-9-1 TaxID=797114 RepID=M0CAE9_9EURY|nr:SHOCT domain-containing protein [Halosimplex carlsbadense]ELZ20271.1 hypothetical protein C475_20897 [Halosimplex carlsbadense 2-9-1]